MSFLTEVEGQEVVGQESKLLPLAGKFKKKHNFPDGLYYFVMGGGNPATNTSKPAVEYWDGSAPRSTNEFVQVDFGSLTIPYVKEGKAAYHYFQWLTNYQRDAEGKLMICPNDPIHELGMDDPDLERFLKVNPASIGLFKKPPTKPDILFYVPVIQLNAAPNKHTKFSEMPEGKVIHLGLTPTTYTKFIAASKTIVTANLDRKYSGMLRRVVQVEVNRGSNDKNSIYKVTATPDVFDVPDLLDVFKNERTQMINYIETNYYQMVNGGKSGVQGAENVWKYICEQTGMTRQQIVNNFYIGKEINPVPDALISIPQGDQNWTDEEESEA